MKSILILLSFLFSLPLLQSCSSSTTTGPGTSELIPDAILLYPLSLGNTWEYRDLEYPEQDCEWTEEVININTTSNSTTAVIRSSGCVGGNQTITINNRNEICFWDVCAIKAGINVGDSYTVTIDGEEYLFSTKKETITVPAGTFEAFTYSFLDDEAEFQLSFSPNVGLVRGRTFTLDGRIDDDNSLVSYSLN